MSKAKSSSHARTVTRFCDEANISEADQLDLAEFIVAAHYLGAEANDEQLMEVFMDVETDIEGKEPRQKLKDLMDKVNAKYGTHSSDDHKGDDTPFRDEIMKQSGDTEDAKWQDVQLGGFLTEAYETQNLKIARNLLSTTAFSVNQIADITGVSLEKLQKLEDEVDEQAESDEEETVVSDSRMVVTVEPSHDITASTGLTITSDQFNKSLALTNTEMQNLEALIVGGEKEVSTRSAEALELLKKLKMAVGLSPGGVKKMKTLRKLRSDLLTTTFSDKEKQQLASEVQKVTEEKEKEIKYPCKYRIVIHPGAMVKEKVELNSTEVGKLPIGTAVTVEEVQGRRARISEPMAGWVSVHTEGQKNKVILQKEGTKSPEMEEALSAERGRQTKILILKSITTLSDATVERLLEKSDWNLRNAIDAFYTAKYKTLEYVLKAQQAQEKKDAESQKNSTESEKSSSASTLSVPSESKSSTGNPTGRRQSKLLFWKSWKKFTVENGGQ